MSFNCHLLLMSTGVQQQRSSPPKKRMDVGQAGNNRGKFPPLQLISVSICSLSLFLLFYFNHFFTTASRHKFTLQLHSEVLCTILSSFHTEVNCQNGDVSILNAKNNTIHTTVISVQMVSFFQKYFCDVQLRHQTKKATLPQCELYRFVSSKKKSIPRTLLFLS